MGYALGVDLGTTYTAAAVSDGRHAEIVPLGDRSSQAPSVLYKAPDGTFRYGEAAERHAAAEPERIAREFKRRMGDKTPIFVAGTPMSAHACSKALLGWAIDQVVAGQGEPPDRVVVTCPANWGPYRRELMSQVTALNTDYPITVCTEPEAAAVHFAASRRVAEGEPIAVYDLGGGTFDAAVLRRTAGGFEVLGSPAGLEQLGGVDFDEAVFERVTRAIDRSTLDPEDTDTMAALARLRRDCTEAKESLSSETETTVTILLGGRVTRVRLTRAEFGELIEPLLTDTIDILDRVIRRAGAMPSELASVVLVGGSSRIPLINERIMQRLGRPAVMSAQPKLCVAMGAALLAAQGNAASTPVIPTVQVVTDLTRMPAPERHSDSASPAALGSPAALASPAAPDVSAGSAAATAGEAAPPGAAAVLATSTDKGMVTPELPTAAAGSASAGAAVRPGRPSNIPTSSQPSQSPPSLRARRPLPVYRLISAACALVALILMFVGPDSDKTGQTWGCSKAAGASCLPPDSFKVDATGQPSDARLNATIFDIAITRPAVPVVGGVFDLRSARVFLAGPVHGTIESSEKSQPVVLSAGERWSPSRFLSVPFVALVVVALFSFAYAESILRPIRRRRARAAAGEFLGLIGAGVGLGVAAALASWVLINRLPEAQTVLLIIASVCTGVGLLAFGWQSRTSGRS